MVTGAYNECFKIRFSKSEAIKNADKAEIKKYLFTGDICENTEYKFKALFSKPYKPEDVQQVLHGFFKIKAAA